MAKPSVTGFTPEASLSDGNQGLNNKDGSTTPAGVTGSNLSAGQAVSVSAGSVSWSGNLTYDATAKTYSVDLLCKNTGLLGDTEDVTVTVGSGNDVSPAAHFNVDVGST